MRHVAWFLLVLFGVWLATSRPVLAQAPRAKVGLLRVESLGLADELVFRLEALFRAELERVEGAPLPSKREVDKILAGDAGARACTGEPVCLAAIGKKLGVAFMVSGTVAALGESYVVNLKLVDVAAAKEVRRVEEPLSGKPDELIEAVRVAAYRLLAPEKLRGSVDVLADVPGAEIFLDGKRVGKTPLPGPIINVSVGKHSLRLTARGYTDFLGEVDVRFQKSSQVIVSLTRAKLAGGDPGVLPERDAPVPWYSSTWGYVGIGVAAVVLGVIVGSALTGDEVVDCNRDEDACR